MAKAVLPDAKDAELRTLAGQIVRDQREIVQMKRWRAAWYGARSVVGSSPKRRAAISGGCRASSDVG